MLCKETEWPIFKEGNITLFVSCADCVPISYSYSPKDFKADFITWSITFNKQVSKVSAFGTVIQVVGPLTHLENAVFFFARHFCFVYKIEVKGDAMYELPGTNGFEQIQTTALRFVHPDYWQIASTSTLVSNLGFRNTIFFSTIFFLSITISST